MESVLERLRESKAEYEKREADCGYDEGVRWVKVRAEYGQLLKLDDIELSNYWDHGDGANCLAEWLDAMIAGDQDSMFESCRDDSKYPSDDYAEAFFRGAVDAWTEVSIKL